MNTHSGKNEVDGYISLQPEYSRQILNSIREIIYGVAPEANELISYGIPTFNINNKHLIHYAGYKNHIGIYPGPTTIEFFRDKLTKYETSKGTIKFPLDKPIPYELIKSITEYNLNKLK